jgi:hypothetical protein
MRLSIRVVFGVALLAGCASAPPRLAQPLVLDFDWEPPFTEQTTGFGKPKTLAQREEMLSLVVRNLFDTRFQEVVLGDDANAPARVALKLSEFGRPQVTAQPPVPGEGQRCGSIEYSVFVGGQETSRDQIALDCDRYGNPDYQRAVLRAADAAAKALSGAV